MGLLFSMFPFYLFGNLHCMGMCGPLVMMISQHRYRNAYFFGRLLSFTLVALASAEAGALLQETLKNYSISSFASFLFAIFLVLFGVSHIFNWHFPSLFSFPLWMKKFNLLLSQLMLKDLPITTFLFGFFTVILPCGQTLIVFSACALSGDWITGLINGFFFAFLTTPSLFFAMHAFHFMKKARLHYSFLIGMSALLAGLIAVLRGLAEMDVISHLSFQMTSSLHLTIY